MRSQGERVAFVVVINRTYRCWGVGAIRQGRLYRTIRLDGCQQSMTHLHAHFLKQKVACGYKPLMNLLLLRVSYLYGKRTDESRCKK